MKHTLRASALGAFLLCLLPGCGGKIVDWTLDHFDQGDPVKDCVSRVECYVQVARIYDQFTFLGGFSALWLSNVVRTEYARLYAFTHGKTREEEKAFAARQLAENEQFITFYVLSANDVPLGTADSDWTVFLRVGNNLPASHGMAPTGAKVYAPLEVKIIDVEPEYKMLFGKEFNRFKTAYRIRFNAFDAQGRKIIASSPLHVALEFRLLCKTFDLCWNAVPADYVVKL